MEYGLASQYMLQVTLGGERLTCTQANGVLQFDGRLALNIQGGGIDTPIYPVEARVELYIDGKLQYTYPIDVAWEPPAGTSDENAAAEIYGDVTYYIHPSENSQGLLPALPYTGGETIDFKAYVRDNLGQEYEVWFQNLGKPGAAVLP